MPDPVMGMLLGLLAGAGAGYAGKRMSETAEKRDAEFKSFMEHAKNASETGDTAFLENPAIVKMAKGYGIEDVLQPLSLRARAAQTQAHLSATLATLGAQRAGAQTAQRGAEIESGTRLPMMQQLLENIRGSGALEVEQGTGTPKAGPEATALITAPVGAAGRAGEVGATISGQKSHERIAGGQLGLGYAELDNKLQLQTRDLAQRQATLEEHRRTTLSAEEMKKLKQDEQKLEKERNDIARSSMENDRNRTKLLDREQKIKLVDTLIGENLTVGESAKATRELTSFFDDKRDDLSQDVQSFTGLSSKKLMAIKALNDEALKMEKEATKMMDDVLSHILTPGVKKARELTPNEIDSRLGQANDLVFKAIQYRVSNKLLSMDDAAEELILKQRVLTNKGEVVNPSRAAGLGRTWKTPVRGFQSAGPGLSKEEQSIIDRFTQPKPMK